MMFSDNCAEIKYNIFKFIGDDGQQQNVRIFNKAQDLRPMAQEDLQGILIFERQRPAEEEEELIIKSRRSPREIPPFSQQHQNIPSRNGILWKNAHPKRKGTQLASESVRGNQCRSFKKNQRRSPHRNTRQLLQKNQGISQNGKRLLIFQFGQPSQLRPVKHGHEIHQIRRRSP